jgi:hypothetical protein
VSFGSLQVKISEDVDETEDEGRDADAKRGDASGEFANTAASENDRKKAAAKEKKKGGSGKKKRKDSKDGEGEGGDTSKPSDHRLTKTISGRRLLLNGSKSTKPQHGDDSPTGTYTDATRVVCVVCVVCRVLTLWGGGQDSAKHFRWSMYGPSSKETRRKIKKTRSCPSGTTQAMGRRKRRTRRFLHFTRAATPELH